MKTNLTLHALTGVKVVTCYIELFFLKFQSQPEQTILKVGVVHEKNSIRITLFEKKKTSQKHNI